MASREITDAIQVRAQIWRSIITDSSFVKAHRGGTRGLLLCPSSYYSVWTRVASKHCFFLLSPLDGSLTSQLSSYLTLDHLDHGCERMGHTNILNGLVCF